MKLLKSKICRTTPLYLPSFKNHNPQQQVYYKAMKKCAEHPKYTLNTVCIDLNCKAKNRLICSMCMKFHNHDEQDDFKPIDYFLEEAQQRQYTKQSKFDDLIQAVKSMETGIENIIKKIIKKLEQYLLRAKQVLKDIELQCYLSTQSEFLAQLNSIGYINIEHTRLNQLIERQLKFLKYSEEQIGYKREWISNKQQSINKLKNYNDVVQFMEQLENATQEFNTKSVKSSNYKECQIDQPLYDILSPYSQPKPPQPKFSIKCNWMSQKIIDVQVSLNDTISEVKSRILSMMNCPTTLQTKLTFNDRALSEQRTIGDYNIKEGDKIYTYRIMRGD